jgi:hypothetical protein
MVEHRRPRNIRLDGFIVGGYLEIDIELHVSTIDDRIAIGVR